MDTDSAFEVTRGKGAGEVDRGKMVKYFMTKGNLTGELTMQYILLNETIKTYSILLINVTPIIFH